MLRAILNKSWRQHPTRHQLYGHLPPITKTIQVRRTRHAGHCWRSRDELISDVLLWTPTYGRAKAGRPARTYIQQLCEDTGCSPEDLPGAMNDREKWRERVRDIRATSTTWWWWWWWSEHNLNVQTVSSQKFLPSTCAQFNSIWPIDRIFSGATSPGQIGPGSDGNKWVLCIPQSFNITGASPSDCSVSYPGHFGGDSYPFSVMQSVYSTAPADWTMRLGWHHSRYLLA